MFGGKTTKMLSELDKHSYRGRDIYAFKPIVDSRYSEHKIVTHNGGSIDSFLVRDAGDILSKLDELSVYDKGDNRMIVNSPVIALDEAFMLDGAGEVLPKLFQAGATIVASTIQLNSDGTPFKEVLGIMPYATRIEVCTSVCSICSADAFYTEKIGGRQDFSIEVGGPELYQPRCFNHFTHFNANKDI